MRPFTLRRALIVCAAASCAATATAREFVAVNSSNFPIDSLVPFDPDMPGAADPNSPVATLTGPFTRGIALTGTADGWYIRTDSTASVPDGPGLYRLDNGVSTLVAPQPFGDSSDTGGLDFTLDGGALWGVIDPPNSDSPNNDTLYRIDFDGTYTEIGEINIVDGFGTSIRISGIATDPATGDIIALDGLRDQLYRIDPLTAQGTVIGDLGVNFDNLTGGLDFDGDGRLIAANNEIGSSGVYELDLATGAVITNLGSLPFSTSSIGFIPAPGSAALLVAAGVCAARRRR